MKLSKKSRRTIPNLPDLPFPLTLEPPTLDTVRAANSKSAPPAPQILSLDQIDAFLAQQSPIARQLVQKTAKFALQVSRKAPKTNKKSKIPPETRLYRAIGACFDAKTPSPALAAPPILVRHWLERNTVFKPVLKPVQNLAGEPKFRQISPPNCPTYTQIVDILLAPEAYTAYRAQIYDTNPAAARDFAADTNQIPLIHPCRTFSDPVIHALTALLSPQSTPEDEILRLQVAAWHAFVYPQVAVLAAPNPSRRIAKIALDSLNDAGVSTNPYTPALAAEVYETLDFDAYLDPDLDAALLPPSLPKLEFPELSFSTLQHSLTPAAEQSIRSAQRAVQIEAQFPRRAFPSPPKFALDPKTNLPIPYSAQLSTRHKQRSLQPIPNQVISKLATSTLEARFQAFLNSRIPEPGAQLLPEPPVSLTDLEATGISKQKSFFSTRRRVSVIPPPNPDFLPFAFSDLNSIPKPHKAATALAGRIHAHDLPLPQLEFLPTPLPFWIPQTSRFNPSTPPCESAVRIAATLNTGIRPQAPLRTPSSFTPINSQVLQEFLKSPYLDTGMSPQARKTLATLFDAQSDSTSTPAAYLSTQRSSSSTDCFSPSSPYPQTIPDLAAFPLTQSLPSFLALPPSDLLWLLAHLPHNILSAFVNLANQNLPASLYTQFSRYTDTLQPYLVVLLQRPVPCAAARSCAAEIV